MRGTIRRVGDSQFDEMQMTLCVCRTTLWRRFSLASSSLPLPSGTVSTPSTSKKRTFMGGLGRRYVVIAQGRPTDLVDAARKCSYRIGVEILVRWAGEHAEGYTSWAETFCFCGPAPPDLRAAGSDLGAAPPGLRAAGSDLRAAPPDLRAAYPDWRAAGSDLGAAPQDLRAAYPDLRAPTMYTPLCVLAASHAPHSPPPSRWWRGARTRRWGSSCTACAAAGAA